VKAAVEASAVVVEGTAAADATNLIYTASDLDHLGRSRDENRLDDVGVFATDRQLRQPTVQ